MNNNSASPMIAYAGISGKRYNGKDSCGDIIDARIRQRFPSIDTCGDSIAFNLKRDYAQDNSLQVEDLLKQGDIKTQHRARIIERADREIAQYGPDVYIQRMFRDIEQSTSQPIGQIHFRSIRDVRRIVETNAFATHGKPFKLIRVNATEETRASRGWKLEPCDSHPTETDLDQKTDWDLVIDNNGTRQELVDKLHTWIDQELVPFLESVYNIKAQSLVQQQVIVAQPAEQQAKQETTGQSTEQPSQIEPLTILSQVIEQQLEQELKEQQIELETTDQQIEQAVPIEQETTKQDVPVDQDIRMVDVPVEPTGGVKRRTPDPEEQENLVDAPVPETPSKRFKSPTACAIEQQQHMIDPSGQVDIAAADPTC